MDEHLNSLKVIIIIIISSYSVIVWMRVVPTIRTADTLGFKQFVYVRRLPELPCLLLAAISAQNSKPSSAFLSLACKLLSAGIKKSIYWTDEFSQPVETGKRI